MLKPQECSELVKLDGDLHFEVVCFSQIPPPPPIYIDFYFNLVHLVIGICFKGSI